MKRFFLTLCALCAIGTLQAASVTVNGVDLFYEIVSNQVAITGTLPGFSGAVEIPPEIDGRPVTSIVPGAFFECTGLTSVTIPDSVTSIGDSAFWGCTGLTSVDIPTGVKIIDKNVFENCYSLTSVKIPEGVTVIEYSAFDECFALRSIEIPSSVTSIGEDAFCYCTSLTSVTFHSGLKTVGICAFNHCESLTSVKIPETVTALGEGAFASCPKLTSITIASGDVSLDYGAFYGCADSATFTFLDTPPTTVAAEAFPERLGYYPAKYATAWETVIDEDGKWNNLKMRCLDEASSYMVSLETIGEGSVTGADEYAEGDEVTLTATPQEGWIFCGWSTDPVVMDSTYIFTMPAEAVALTAYFAPAVAIEQHVSAKKLMTRDDAKQELLDADEVFTADEMKEMAFEAPVVEVGADAIEISISLQTADTLDAWEAMALQGATLEVDQEAGKVRVRVPKGDKKAAFYKFVVPTDQSK